MSHCLTASALLKQKHGSLVPSLTAVQAFMNFWQGVVRDLVKAPCMCVCVGAKIASVTWYYLDSRVFTQATLAIILPQFPKYELAPGSRKIQHPAPMTTLDIAATQRVEGIFGVLKNGRNYIGERPRFAK